VAKIKKRVSDPYGEHFVSVRYDSGLDSCVIVSIETEAEIEADIRLPRRQAVLLAHALMMCECSDDEYDKGEIRQEPEERGE